MSLERVSSLGLSALILLHIVRLSFNEIRIADAGARRGGERKEKRGECKRSSEPRQVHDTVYRATLDSFSNIFLSSPRSLSSATSRSYFLPVAGRSATKWNAVRAGQGGTDSRKRAACSPRRPHRRIIAAACTHAGETVTRRRARMRARALHARRRA